MVELHPCDFLRQKRGSFLSISVILRLGSDIFTPIGKTALIPSPRLKVGVVAVKAKSSLNLVVAVAG